MNDNVNLALQLLLVGMGSVFIILGIVVLVGRSLISIVNKYSPAVEKPAINRKKSATTTSLDAKNLAVLTAVVDTITKQRGVLTTVEKIPPR